MGALLRVRGRILRCPRSRRTPRPAPPRPPAHGRRPCRLDRRHARRVLWPDSANSPRGSDAPPALRPGNATSGSRRRCPPWRTHPRNQRRLTGPVVVDSAHRCSLLELGSWEMLHPDEGAAPLIRLPERSAEFTSLATVRTQRRGAPHRLERGDEAASTGRACSRGETNEPFKSLPVINYLDGTSLPEELRGSQASVSLSRRPSPNCNRGGLPTSTHGPWQQSLLHQCYRGEIPGNPSRTHPRLRGRRVLPSCT